MSKFKKTAVEVDKLCKAASAAANVQAGPGLSSDLSTAQLVVDTATAMRDGLESEIAGFAARAAKSGDAAVYGPGMLKKVCTGHKVAPARLTGKGRGPQRWSRALGAVSF